MAKHIMLDLETLGTTRGSIVRQIGAVEFDPDAGTLGSTFLAYIDPVSAEAAGLKVGAATVMWWFGQKPEALAAMAKPGEPIEKVLGDFSKWVQRIGKPDEINIWGNSSNFDNELLKSAYEAVGMAPPWGFRGDRCYRTLRAVFKDEVPQLPEITLEHCHSLGLSPGTIPEDARVAHNALWDAVMQSVHLLRVYEHMRVNTSGPDSTASLRADPPSSEVKLFHSPFHELPNGPEQLCPVARRFWMSAYALHNAQSSLSNFVSQNVKLHDKYHALERAGIKREEIFKSFPNLRDLIMSIDIQTDLVLTERANFNEAFEIAMKAKTRELSLARLGPTGSSLDKIPEMFHGVFTDLAEWRARNIDGLRIDLIHFLPERDAKFDYSAKGRGFGAWFTEFASVVAPSIHPYALRGGILETLRARKNPTVAVTQSPVA